MLKPCLAITIIALISSVAIAQEERIEIRGEIQDVLDKTPLSYAHIWTKERGSGVPTNNEGKFALNLPKEAVSDSLTISLIGYTSKTVPINKLLEKDYHIIFLEKSTIYMEEVVIEAEHAECIIKKVSSQLKDNFPEAPFEFEGYYRNSYRESDQYVSQFETAFSGFEGNFHNRSGHSVKMLKKRISPDFRRFKWRQSQGNIPWHYLWHIRKQHNYFFAGKQYQQYDYSLEDITYFNGEEVYKLKFLLKDKSERIGASWVFIRAKDYAILEIRGDWKIVNPKITQLSDSLSLAYTGGNILVKFLEYQGKMYPSYSRSLYQHDAYDIQANRQGSFDMNEELIVHSIITPSTFSSKREFERAQQTKIQSLPIDSVYWEHYNKPVETALSKAIQRDLEAQQYR